jgi:hypothetical protein
MAAGVMTKAYKIIVRRLRNKGKKTLRRNNGYWWILLRPNNGQKNMAA